MLLAAGALLNMTGCGPVKKAIVDLRPSQTVEATVPPPSALPTAMPAVTSEPTLAPTAEDIFPREFCFMIGAGGWCTELHIADDGTFTGGYFSHQLFPENDGAWELYVCEFSGKFSELEKVNEYTYSTQMEELTIEQAQKGLEGADLTPVEERTAPGLEGGEEFLIYLPGAPLDELPEEFLYWIRAPHGIEEEDTVLPGYGLYNVNEQLGWF